LIVNEVLKVTTFVQFRSKKVHFIIVKFCRYRKVATVRSCMGLKFRSDSMKSHMIILGLMVSGLSGAGASVLFDDRLQEAHESLLDNRRGALSSLSDPFGVPPSARAVVEEPGTAFREAFKWKRNVISTVFWVGEAPSENNPVPNTKSAWDQDWQASFGGYDDPARRSGYSPAAFTPQGNPFYVALPYNDLGKNGRHRPEASEVIPWFWEAYRGDSVSVCKGRWIAIHQGGKVCYAQWEDVGPFEVDHFQYVFGAEPPRPNRNKNAGIDVSPAVRDFLGLNGIDRVEWRFVENHEVPPGPWKSGQALPAR
jgi:hypothetical protein